MSILEHLNQKMNGGKCPTDKAIGECPIVTQPRTWVFEATLLIWLDDFKSPEIVAGWLKELGAEEISISELMYCEIDGFRNGVSIEEGVRQWVATFYMEDGKP